MSQRDVLAELRAARITAPAEVRERVVALAATAPRAPRRLTWRRSLAVVVPAAAAIAAAVVFTRSSSHPVAVTTISSEGAVRAAGAAPVPAAPGANPRALVIPSPKQRVQNVGIYLSLRTRHISEGVKQAVRIATSLSGYAASIHADLDQADLTLKVPRAHVQQATTRLAALGTIVGENVDVTDETAGLNAADREIARLRAQLNGATPARAAALTERIRALQRSEAATRRAAHYATIALHLETPHAAAAGPTHHGPLHGVVVALTWLGIGAVYALAIGLPVLLVLVLGWLAARVVRRRREDALLSRP
jgi:hypothetical protein